MEAEDTRLGTEEEPDARAVEVVDRLHLLLELCEVKVFVLRLLICALLLAELLEKLQVTLTLVARPQYGEVL